MSGSVVAKGMGLNNDKYKTNNANYMCGALTSAYPTSSGADILGGMGAIVGGMTTLRLEARPFWLPGDCCLMDKWWAARRFRLVGNHYHRLRRRWSKLGDVG